MLCTDAVLCLVMHVRRFEKEFGQHSKHVKLYTVIPRQTPPPLSALVANRYSKTPNPFAIEKSIASQLHPQLRLSALFLDKDQILIHKPAHPWFCTGKNLEK